MKGDQAKKYYDFAAKYELNNLFETGAYSSSLKQCPVPR